MIKMLKAKCFMCDEVVNYPASDKTIEVIHRVIQNDCGKYHKCKKQSTLERFK